MRPCSSTVLVSLGALLSGVFVVGQLAGGCLFSTADDCGLMLGFRCGAPTSSAAGGQGGTTSSSVVGGTGGTGGAGSTGGTGGTLSTSSEDPECTSSDTSACAAVPSGPCSAFGYVVCESGKCGIVYTSHKASSNRWGSCKALWCDTNGNLQEVVDDDNVYDDGNPCTKESCSNGLPKSVAVATDTPCGMGFCETDPAPGAKAVVCADCKPTDPEKTCGGIGSGMTCITGKCYLASCNNLMKDPGERDVDCGGSACPGCSSNKTCVDGSDCASQVCTSGTCMPPSCPDGAHNQDETDYDCGGENCLTRCITGRTCLLPSDCLSGVCMPTTPGNPNKCAAPTCTDGVKNGLEEGIDCGDLCPPCGCGSLGVDGGACGDGP